MRLLMLAPPGAGKGTQADRLAARYDLAHISSGEMLRAAVAAGTPLGEKVRDYLRRGDLVPDEVLLDLAAAPVIAAAAGNGYVLDGFPRTVAQAEAARHMIGELDGVGLQAVLHLAVSDEEVRARMAGRAGTDGRSDDTPTTVAHRLEVFHAQTEPLLDYYEGRGLLHTVDGERAPDEVFTAIATLLDGLGLT